MRSITRQVNMTIPCGPSKAGEGSRDEEIAPSKAAPADPFGLLTSMLVWASALGIRLIPVDSPRGKSAGGNFGLTGGPFGGKV